MRFGAFGAGAEVDLSTSGATVKTTSGATVKTTSDSSSSAHGPSSLGTFPKKAEWQYAPLNMHMEANPTQRAALRTGSEKDLLAAVKQAMIEMDFMGALAEALPTPIKSLAAEGGFYRVSPALAAITGDLAREQAGPGIASILYPKLMAVAEEVRQMPPSLASRPDLARYLQLTKLPSQSKIALLSMNPNLLAALKKPAATSYAVPIAIGAGVLLLGGAAWYFTRKK